MAKSETNGNKQFTITKTKTGKIVLRINEGQFVLDDKEQYRLVRFFNRIMHKENLPYPEVGISTYITYDTGVNAVTLSAGKLDPEATKFYLSVVYMTPSNDSYKSDAFLLTSNVINDYMTILGGRDVDNIQL